MTNVYLSVMILRHLVFY